VSRADRNSFPASRTKPKGTGTVNAPVAVGAAINGSDPFGATFHAFRWTPVGGLGGLGACDRDQSIALAIFEDGSMVVGEATDVNGLGRAFRRTAERVWKIWALLVARKAPHILSVRMVSGDRGHVAYGRLQRLH